MVNKIIASVAISAMIFGAGIGFNRLIDTGKIDRATQIIQQAQHRIQTDKDQNKQDKEAVQKLIDYTKNLEQQIDTANGKLNTMDTETTKLEQIIKEDK